MRRSSPDEKAGERDFQELESVIKINVQSVVRSLQTDTYQCWNGQPVVYPWPDFCPSSRVEAKRDDDDAEDGEKNAYDNDRCGCGVCHD